MPERVLCEDENGFYEEDRDRVHSDGSRHFCVHVIAVDGTRIYLQRRKDDRPRNPNCWTSTASGRVTSAYARDHQQMLMNQHAALVTLRNELKEELGLDVDVDRVASYLGTTLTVSRGPNEICNCITWVFSMPSEGITSISTAEVEEVVAFDIAEVTSALAVGGKLRGGDGREYAFADNFRPVFEVFVKASLTGAAG